MQSGWGKLHNLPGVTDFFTSLGIPAPHFTAIAISNLELFGAVLLAFGPGVKTDRTCTHRKHVHGLRDCRPTGFAVDLL
jgi:DoxX